jgi:hypothetical protein
MFCAAPHLSSVLALPGRRQPKRLTITLDLSEEGSDVTAGKRLNATAPADRSDVTLAVFQY